MIRAKFDERLSPLGLTQAKWLILMLLSKNGGVMPQREISERIGVEGPTVVRVLDGLENMGLIERRDQPADRRTKDVYLTREAGDIVKKISRTAEEFREEIWAGIPEKDVVVCARVIATLLLNLGALGRETA
jgi:MarR family transcriptional regulator for hemolysin